MLEAVTRRLGSSDYVITIVEGASERATVILCFYLSGSTPFEILDPLITLAACLSQLPSHLDFGLVDTFANRADLPLPLLDIRPGIGQSSSKTVVIAVQSIHVAAQAALLSFE